MERTITIHSYFNPPPPVDTVIEGETLTQQHFKDKCDVNYIIELYVQTGVLGDPLKPGSGEPMFGDFASSIDFHSSQNLIAQATQAFDALPSALRKRFNNDPGQLLSFLEDDSNRDEAEKLGLVNKKAAPTETATPAKGGTEPPKAE